MLSALSLEMEPTLKTRKLTITIRDFEGNKDWIYIDPTRITQALRNVIHNAIKYTPDGGKITVDGRKLTGFIEVTVADTGIGISAENQKTIFEKFGQVESRQGGRMMSTGLGLTFCKLAVEAHGGRIEVESEQEKGSVFTLYLPAEGTDQGD